MSNPAAIPLLAPLATLLTELVDGAADDQGWILNPGDPGLLQSLERLTAAAASAATPLGGPSIAAHVDHLSYGLQLLNRWSRGEDSFSTADYSASWSHTQVTDQQWADLRDQLRIEADRWREAIAAPREISDLELTGVIASVAHLAYHMGAIRQIDRATRGPQARD